MVADNPRRRKTDHWNGRLRLALTVLLPWLFVVGGWFYSLGVNAQRLDAVEQSMIDARARVEVLQAHSATGTAELARLAEAVDNLEETIRELRLDIREQR